MIANHLIPPYFITSAQPLQSIIYNLPKTTLSSVPVEFSGSCACLVRLRFFIKHLSSMLNSDQLCLKLRILVLVIATIFMVSAAGVMGGDSGEDKDKEECTEQLVGLATCLPYVGGNAKAPTPDCCSGLKQVLKNNKKCLCIIIKDRNDPDLGLNINVTLALSLPSVCNAPANISKCPELLHMDPNSPEAQVFYQLSKSSSSNGGHQGPASAPTASVGGSPISSSEGEKSPELQKGHGNCYGCRRNTWVIVTLWTFLLCYFMPYF
ncbi:hypothetical protein Golob_012450 [Gossypium lobatum]|uniref:Bifunctional inhibitor/plant lipid transfer protein/seed storage helical domain-containing protein n=1 Tax=Gossypium lobatum TaxID=34289 RepID=A0A7J8LLB5_9ROSI|nr:hypothetical protein [Gossypium lobatum]